MNERTILAVSGADRDHFLQGLITNDVKKAKGGIAYAALLTPQGKYLADFFVVGQEDRLLIDVDSAQASALAMRLSMYKLRADVQIADSGLKVRTGTGAPPEGALVDPRDPGMGWRLYGAEGGDDGSDWAALRVAHQVPAYGAELGPDSYILEMGFERLNGVDFRKGCYVGQEVTARMKHKTELRKGLARLRLAGAVAPGTPILSGDKEAGIIHTVAGDHALSYVRFDRAEAMTAGGIAVEID